MGVFNSSHTAWARVRQTLAWLLLIYGTLLLIGASAGSKSLVKPLQNILVSAEQHSNSVQHLEFQQIRGVAGLQATLELARAQSKPVLLDFYADWCISCKELDAYTFTDNNVQSTLDGFILIQTDVTENNQEDQALLTSLGLFGPPALLFFDNNGKEHKPSRLVGFIDAPAFVEHINHFKLKN
jgi:thiol:disulfide interchange protein DsbD